MDACIHRSAGVLHPLGDLLGTANGAVSQAPAAVTVALTDAIARRAKCVDPGRYRQR
jgi:hypothetical protein